jgi:hypothetical protein
LGVAELLADETRVVASHIVIMAAPPDNRLSPLGAAWGAPRLYTVVRALAFPLQGATIQEASRRSHLATLDASCVLSGVLHAILCVVYTATEHQCGAHLPLLLLLLLLLYL